MARLIGMWGIDRIGQWLVRKWSNTANFKPRPLPCRKARAQRSAIGRRHKVRAVDMNHFHF